MNEIEEKNEGQAGATGSKTRRELVVPDSPIKVWADVIMGTKVIFRLSLFLVLLGAVMALDVATGPEVSFGVFYLVPVSGAGWLISRRAGLFIAILSAIAWGYIEVVTGRAFSAVWIPYWNGGVRLVFFIFVNELIERLRREHTRQKVFANQDALTGITNARVFQEDTKKIMAASDKSGVPFSLAYVDLDKFKLVNDQFGHAEGDRLLRMVASIVQENARATDVAGRLGGDEFGLLMPKTTREEAEELLQKVGEIISEEVGMRWGVGVTIGAVTFNKAPPDVQAALETADKLMYNGKKHGGGKILVKNWPEQGI